MNTWIQVSVHAGPVGHVCLHPSSEFCEVIKEFETQYDNKVGVLEITFADHMGKGTSQGWIGQLASQCSYPHVGSLEKGGDVEVERSGPGRSKFLDKITRFEESSD